MTQWHIYKSVFLIPPPAPHLRAQMALVCLNGIPQLYVRALHLVFYLTIYVRVSRLGCDGVNTSFFCTCSSEELNLETFGEHGERIPGPDYSAMVGACCEFLPVRGVKAVSWVCNENADGREKAGGKHTQDRGAKRVDRLEVLNDACWVGRVD